nr:MAG TPA: hypothetical protein [Caudoviricetes sp.]
MILIPIQAEFHLGNRNCQTYPQKRAYQSKKNLQQFYSTKVVNFSTLY